MINDIPGEIVRFDEIDSTNDEAKRYLESKEPGKGVIILAEQQTKGKGRLGREWNTSSGKNIMMSLLRETSLPADRISAVTLLAGIAVADAINEKLSEDISGSDGQKLRASIKWPNDIVINKKKVCGILTELCIKEEKKYIIPGIGINVNETSYPDDLKDKATSLLLETGKEWDRDDLIEAVISRLASLIDLYEKSWSLEFIKDHYNSLLINKDSEVYLTGQDNDGNGQNSEKVISRGIDENGALLVEDAEGIIKAVISGEVSVRGLYGYV